MIFKLLIDRNCQEEIIANVHERTPLIDEIERLVLQDQAVDEIVGYTEDAITMLTIKDIEYFTVEDEKTYAVCGKNKKYHIKKRLYELDDLLNPDYVRLSKSVIANKRKIVKYKTQFSGAVDAVFESGNTECISRRCLAELKRRYGL